MNEIVSIIPAMTAVVLAFWGIYVFNKQQKYKRLQNLSQIFQRFADKKEFVEIFNLFDQSISLDREKKQPVYNHQFLDQLSAKDSEDKLKYLALLEDVALYAKTFEVDRAYAVHLFQWHFYYVYNDPKTTEAFWQNLGGKEETNEPCWEYQKAFSAYCNPIKSYLL